MNLFGGGTPAAAPVQAPPSVDEAQTRVDQLRKGRTLRGRASTMLTQGKQSAPTAQATVTGS